MSEFPLTTAEKHAEHATQFPTFQINLYSLRDHVRFVLTELKSSGLFYEYTDHSFSHVNDMLKAVEWIIPQQTQQIMTPADWFMLVVSIYLHDLGLLITKREFDSRDSNNDYQTFLENKILDEGKDKEYKAYVSRLSDEESDKLNYQEFVRYTHGKRVKSWLMGKFSYKNDIDKEQREIVDNLVNKIDNIVRKDLALLCESHTLGDVDNTSIFKVSQPYGGEQETVNLQYCAVILRTVDLIQITKKRTPSVLYQLIDPTNPLSQVEWLRHNAVRTVRSAPARDRDGSVNPAVQSDTIEVHATFEEPNGFFALTSYLSYAAKEISLSYKAIRKSERDLSQPYLFPWKNIDTSNIDTEGFLTEQFEFELDQRKILDLLTGHTLYNNTDIVLREMAQNALDASSTPVSD